MRDFYQKYYQRIRGFVSARISDEGVAEEITNDILLAAFNSLAVFEGKSSESGWVYGIAKHKIVDYYRKKKIKTVLFSANPMFEEVADKALSPERDALKEELKGEIKKTLREIGEGYRRILRLKYIRGLKVEEIARKMRLTTKAVESRLIRARKKFALEWQYDNNKKIEKNWTDSRTDSN